MKKLLLTIALAFGLVALTGCDQFALPSSTDNSITQVTDLSSSSVIDPEELAVQVASVNSLIIPFLESNDVSLLNYALLDETTTEDPLIDDQVADLDKYLDLLNQFLNNSNGLNVSVVESDRAEYAFEVVYTVFALDGTSKVYVLYYNEVVTDEVVTEDPVADEPTTEDPVTEDPAAEDPVTEEGTDATTLSFNPDGYLLDDAEAVLVSIEGILVDGDQETALQGVLVQTDTEQVLRLSAVVDEANYIRVSYKTDSEDLSKKFFYEVVSDGVKVSESKISVHEEDGETSIRLELLEGTSFVKFDAHLETVDNVTQIRIRYAILSDGVLVESGNVIIIKTVDPETLEVTYEYTVLPDGFLNGYLYKGHGGHHGGDIEKGQPFHQEDNPGQGPWHDQDNQGGHMGGAGHGHHGDATCNDTTEGNDVPADDASDIPADSEI